MYRFPLLIACCLMASIASGQKDTGLLSPRKFEKAIAAPQAQVLDVRTAEEYKQGHIKNSILADWKNPEEFVLKVQSLDSTRPVYVYCLAGIRSHAAATFLRVKGFKQVYELDGGYKKWTEEKKPVQQ